MPSPQIEAAAASTRTEEEVRDLRASNVTMLDVIRRASKPHAKGCPWCASSPLPARLVIDRYVIGCENDDCYVQPQVSGKTPSEAAQRWDARA